MHEAFFKLLLFKFCKLQFYFCASNPLLRGKPTMPCPALPSLWRGVTFDVHNTHKHVHALTRLARTHIPTHTKMRTSTHIAHTLWLARTCAHTMHTRFLCIRAPLENAHRPI